MHGLYLKVGVIDGINYIFVIGIAKGQFAITSDLLTDVFRASAIGNIIMCSVFQF